MSEDTEYLKRIYPENFPSATLIDWILAIFVLVFFLLSRIFIQGLWNQD